MWWLLLLLPLLLIIFLLFLKVRICISYEEELSVKVKVLFLNIPIIPQKEKKIKKLSAKKHKKQQEKLAKKSQKNEEKKQLKKQHKEAAPKKKLSETVTEVLDLVKIVLNDVIPTFGKHLKIEIVKLYIRVSSNDPANTAVTYGVVSQSVAYIVELLSNVTNVDVKKPHSINVFPDFFSEKSEASINITFGLRVWHALSVGLKFVIGFIKSKMKKQTPPQNNTDIK